MNKEDLDFIIAIEDEMDKANGNFGRKNCFCLFCRAKEYDGKVGIIHVPNCPIIALRNKTALNKK